MIIIFIMYYLFAMHLLRYLPFISRQDLIFKKSLHRTYTLLIYLYSDQILFNNSSDSSKNDLLNSFSYHFFLKSSELFVKFSTLLRLLIWLGNLFRKYITLLAKHPIS